MGIKSLGDPTSTYNAVWGQTAKGAVTPAPPGAFEATGGTTNEPGNGYKYHLFTHPNSDSFEVTNVAGTPGVIEVLVVAGGGGGGNGGGAGGGGGGAGGVRNFPVTLTATGVYPITVGDGGAALAYDTGPKAPAQGGDSAFNSPGGNSTTQIYATGGGGAGTYGEHGAGNLKAGMPGGSAGGQGTYPAGYTTPRAATVASPDGRTPTVQGYDGGYAGVPASGINAGSGGGGAGAQGGDASDPNDVSGTGGNGAPFPAFAYPLCFPAPMLPAFATPTNPLTGYVTSPTSDHYGGGGGGSSGEPPQSVDYVDGGTGGGGAGYNRYGPSPGPGPAKAGVDGLGGGGGGTAAGNATNTGAGGAGSVIIRYAV